MVEPNDIDNLHTEAKNQLDDLFDENDALSTDNENGDISKHYPLSELKNLILSIDWEITDEVLAKLLQQIEDLRMMYAHDKTVLTLLRILNSLGAYIKKKQAKAHPKTFKTLNSVFSSLDKVVRSKDMKAVDKKKLLNTEMDRYRKLRIQVAHSQAEKKKHEKKRQDPGDKSPNSFFQTPNFENKDFLNAERLQEPSSEALVKAVEEIKQYIHSEIEALKTEIKSLLE